MFANYNEQLSDIFREANTRNIDEKTILDAVHETDIELFKEITKTISNYQCQFDAPCDYFTFAIKIKGKKEPTNILVTIFPSSIHIPHTQEPNSITYCNIELSKNSKSGNFAIHSLQDDIESYCLMTKLILKTRCILLTPMEILIFKYSGLGYSELEISKMLNISTSRLKAVKSKIMDFINARSTPQVIATLAKQGFI